MVLTGAGQGAAGPDGRQRGELERGLEGLRLGRRHVLRRADERQHEVAGVVLAEVLHGARLHGADDVGGPDVAVRARSPRTASTKPWCGGISSGTASGWPATDWLEEVVLGTYGGQVYDTGSATRSSSTSPQIMAAMTDRAQLDAEPGVGQRRLRRRQVDRHHDVPERRPADPEEPVRDAAAGVVLRGAVAEGHQGRPERRRLRVLPARRSTRRSPTRSRAAASSSPRSPTDPATQAVQNYLSSPEWANSRIKVAPGWVSANQKVDQSLYTDPIDKLSAKYLADPTATFRVRRLRPDAGRGRRGPGVEVDGRLVQQPEHADRHRRLADRRGLAKQLI